MNSDQIEGSWEVLKGKLQRQWGKLTGDDFDVIEGDRKQIAGRIQERYGYTKEQADQEFDNWLSSR
jgi:uncharacterized protein YjbJ (UPF0337 family)